LLHLNNTDLEYEQQSALAQSWGDRGGSFHVREDEDEDEEEDEHYYNDEDEDEDEED